MANKYLLDTNICVFILRGLFNIDKKLQKIGISHCCISEITVAELLFGAECSKDVKKNMTLVKNLCNLIEIIPISNSLEAYAKQKSILRKKGMPIEDLDLLIGCAAISNKCILVTDNTKHLSRIPIKIENWVERSS